jgi:urease accessory protein
MRSTGSVLVSPQRSKRRSAAHTAAVGRVGIVLLEYVRQGNRTVFGRTRCQTPWHLLPPIYLDESGSAYTLLMNPSGGLVGGDHLSIELSIGPQAHALISTPSANRVYRSLSQDALQEVVITVAKDGILEWMPEFTIPFAGSRFRQRIDVRLDCGAMLVLWDAVASGRIAHGERWQFASFENHIVITMPTQATVAEHSALSPVAREGGIGPVEEWDYVGSLFIVGDTVSASRWTSLEAALWEILETVGGQDVLGGVSQPSVPGLVVKVVARSAPVMTRVLMDMWASIRQILWQLSPAILRKY